MGLRIKRIDDVIQYVHQSGVNECKSRLQDKDVDDVKIILLEDKFHNVPKCVLEVKLRKEFLYTTADSRHVKVYKYPIFVIPLSGYVFHKIKDPIRTDNLFVFDQDDREINDSLYHPTEYGYVVYEDKILAKASWKGLYSSIASDIENKYIEFHRQKANSLNDFAKIEKLLKEFECNPIDENSIKFFEKKLKNNPNDKGQIIIFQQKSKKDQNNIITEYAFAFSKNGSDRNDVKLMVSTTKQDKKNIGSKEKKIVFKSEQKNLSDFPNPNLLRLYNEYIHKYHYNKNDVDKNNSFDFA